MKNMILHGPNNGFLPPENVPLFVLNKRTSVVGIAIYKEGKWYAYGDGDMYEISHVDFEWIQLVDYYKESTNNKCGKDCKKYYEKIENQDIYLRLDSLEQAFTILANRMPKED